MSETEVNDYEEERNAQSKLSLSRNQLHKHHCVHILVLLDLLAVLECEPFQLQKTVRLKSSYTSAQHLI